MSCPRFETELDDYVDETLTDAERDEVGRHLAECPACRRSVEELRRLLRAAGDLPRQIRPPRDLLPEIRAAVREGVQARDARAPSGSPANWSRWGAIAASLVIVSAAALTAMLLGTRREPITAGTPASRVVQASSTPATAALRSAEEEYVRATRILLDSFEQQRDRLDPEAAATVEKNLRIIDQAIGEIRSALDADPNHPGNARALTAMYQQKLRLLWRASRLSS